MAVRVEQQAEPIPGYRLIERIGGGGFGEVWRAEAPGGLQKAIKFVFGDLSNASDGQRAEQELKSLKRVQSVRHPYILSLERYDIIDGQLMIVMELADRNLWDRYKECRSEGLPGIPRDELLRYMEESAEALDLMNNEYGLQHLDIKPQNLFVVHQHVKVADFGLVKDLEGSQASITGGITPVYAAPETFDGRVTRYSDQYSLAIVFQELLTGQRPFNGANVRQLIMQHLQAPPNVSPLPPADQPHIARALRKLPEERFPTCRELVLALRAGSSGSPGSAGGDVPEVRTGPEGEGASFVTGALTPGLTPGTILVRGPSASMQAIAQASGGSAQGVAPSPIPGLSALAANLRAPAPDTGSGQGTTHCLRALEPSVLKEEEGFHAPPEIKGPGTLFPAVVIGLGQTSLPILQRLRASLQTSVAPLAQLPHLRFLLIDTDPEVIRHATRGQPSARLAASDVVLAQLNRPSHYLKPREGRPKLESWLNPRILYRIPRSQVTTGVRALGRLAFTDHYRSILRRLQMELEAALEPQALITAGRDTGLGLRSNRPRVYIVCGLAGGTGSGMFLDVAYTVRALLRKMGYDPPDVVGMLLLPEVDKSRTRALARGNAFAALTELNYFGSPNTTFKARYHEREPAIEDRDPPFTRSVLLPLAEEGDEAATQQTFALCAALLHRDLATPLGKAADLGRAGLSTPPWEERGQFFQTFGLFQMSWPRPALLGAMARRLCQRTVQRWLSKDSKPLREAVQTWVQQQWAERELGADQFIHRLQAEVVKVLGKPPDALFAALIDPLARLSAQGAPPSGVKSQESGVKETKAADPAAVIEVLKQLEEVIGRPGEDPPADRAPQLVKLLREGGERLGGEWSQKLAEVSVHLIEAPAYRLAGAEEAIRQAVATIEQVLAHHEPLAQDLSRKAAAAHERLRAACAKGEHGQKRGTFTAQAAVDLLRSYAKHRQQSLVLQHLTAAFVSLRGHLSDEQREVNFCRVRLGELAARFEKAPAEEEPDRPAPEVSPGGKAGRANRRLFLSGCKDLAAAVDLCLQSVTPDQMIDLDERMEEMLNANFVALVHVCLTSANVLKDVEGAMLQTARDYATGLLPATSVARLFLEQHPGHDQAEAELVSFFDEAEPELSRASTRAGSGPQVAELCVLAVPEDEAGESVRKLVEKALPETEVQHAASPDDLLVYRERNNLALRDLEHLGPLGHDAYVQMSATENFTPHSRCDIDFRLRTS
jgi:hypothetical protein